MSVTRRTWTDDSGNLSSGSIVNNAELQRIYDDIDARWSVVTITSVGTQNNLAISDADFVIFNNATDLTVTGIGAPSSPAKPGKPLRFVCTGAGNVFFAHQNAGSTAANRLVNFATSGNTPCAGGSGSGVYVYDATASRWRLIQHEQGAFITRTFAAGNYTASAGNWTVASAGRDAYKLEGRKLTYSFSASGTTSGAPVSVKIGLPFTAAAIDTTAYYISNSGGGASEGGYAASAAASALISFQRFANTAFGTGTVAVLGQIAVEVT